MKVESRDGVPVQGTILIERAAAGRGFRLTASQFLPRPRDEVFAFFSDAFRLEDLTPPWLNFSVLTLPEFQMASGTLIDYRLKLRGIPVRWQSRISRWDPPRAFVDEQTRGPYRRWHHEHRFESVDGGTKCLDLVDYEVYGGALMHALLVRRDLLKIFAYRQSRLAEEFG